MRKLGMCGGFAAAIALMSAVPAYAQAPAVVKVDSRGGIKGLGRIVIGQFTVGFVTDRTDQATARGFNVAGIGGGKAVLHQKLAGISDAELQAATDAAYDDFVARLTKAGFQLQDRAGFIANADIAKSKPVDAPYVGGFARDRGNVRISYFGASATAPYRLTTESSGSSITAGFAGIGNAIAFSKGMASFVHGAQVHVINVIYAVDFAQAKRNGGFAASEANVKANAELAVLADQSRVQVYAPSMSVATLTLAKPLQLPADFFTQGDVTTAGSKRSQAIGNAITGIFGSGSSSSSKDIAFTPAPGRYVPAVVDAARITNEAMVAQLTALR